MFNQLKEKMVQKKEEMKYKNLERQTKNRNEASKNLSTNKKYLAYKIKDNARRIQDYALDSILTEKINLSNELKIKNTFLLISYGNKEVIDGLIQITVDIIGKDKIKDLDTFYKESSEELRKEIKEDSEPKVETIVNVLNSICMTNKVKDKTEILNKLVLEYIISNVEECPSSDETEVETDIRKISKNRYSIATKLAKALGCKEDKALIIVDSYSNKVDFTQDEKMILIQIMALVKNEEIPTKEAKKVKAQVESVLTDFKYPAILREILRERFNITKEEQDELLIKERLYIETENYTNSFSLENDNALFLYATNLKSKKSTHIILVLNDEGVTEEFDNIREYNEMVGEF